MIFNESRKPLPGILCAASSGFFSLLLSACGSNPTPAINSQLPNGSELKPVSGPNVMMLTVDGSTCSVNSYQNKPCVSVTLCPTQANERSSAGDSCQTFNDILLDTGSVGLRIFSSIVQQNILTALTPVTLDGNPVAECVKYADGSADWGPVNYANVQLASEPNVRIPIQLIDSSYANPATYCSDTPDLNPAQAQFNGILGLGLFAQDCGTGCVTQDDNNIYFTCTGSDSDATCTSTKIPLISQVANPVTLLPVDNNGITVELPSISPQGAPSAQGYVILGIGTETNNLPSQVTAFAASLSVGEFDVKFNGTDYPNSFIDSGSNGIFFEAPGSLFPDCGSNDPALANWFCPNQIENLQATSSGYLGAPAATASFQITNLYQLLNNTPNYVFSDIGGTMADTTSFDWGLPFYFGRNISVGFENARSPLGQGPYWAF